MSVQARIYIGCVIAVGGAGLGNGFFHWEPHDLVRLFCYFSLAIPASCLQVRLPGITGTMSVLFVFLLAGIVDLGLPETLLVGVVCVLVQSFWHARVRPRPVQLVFSAANISFAVWISHFVFRSVAGIAPFLEAPFRLSVAASAFFVANTFPLAPVVALTERKCLSQVLGSCYFLSFAHYRVG